MHSGGPWLCAAALTALALSGCEGSSRVTYAASICGNAVLEPGEQCDDGNRIDDDGCTNDCVDVRCTAGSHWHDGACRSGCLGDDDCTRCQRCGDGQCVEDTRQPGCQCTEDAHCGPCEQCVAGECEPAWGRPGCQCLVDDDCDPCERCTNGTCVTDLERPGCQCTRDEECADGDPCSGEERCLAGLCAPGIPVVCDASPCHIGMCINFGGHARCTTALAPDGIQCAADDICGIDYRCLAGRCEATAAIPCPAEPCFRARCDADRGGCVREPEPVGTPCNDDDPCTLGEMCDGAGACVGIFPVPCPEQDENPCTLPVCEAGGCTEVPVMGQPCEVDGDPCTLGTCLAGVCVESAGCDDGILCTTDTCDPNGGCVHTPNDAFCDDGSPCTHDVCDPQNGCTTVRDTNFTPCDDGDPLTSPDICYGETCAGAWLEEHHPGSTCPCSCSSWATAGLHAHTGEFLLLVNRSFDSDPGVAGCGGPADYAWVYELTERSELSPTHSVLGVGNDIDLGYVLGATTDNSALLGIVDVDNSVRWTGTPMHEALPTDAGPLRAVATNSFGAPNRTQVWLAGRSADESGFAAHCERTGAGTATCERVFDLPDRDVVGVQSALRVLPCSNPPCQRAYDGTVLASNASGGGQLYFDAGRDFLVDMPGPTWDRPLRGSVRRDGLGQEVLHYGDDGLLVHCRKTPGQETWTCAELTSVSLGPGMHIRDAALTWDQEAVLAVQLMVDPSTWLNLLMSLPRSGDPHDIDAWQLVPLPGFGEPPSGGPAVRAVAGSRDALYVVGDDTATGHVVVWSFGQ